MAFRDLHGHRRVLALLARSIARDTLPPSLIFAGGEGSGARDAALSVAQALNCTDLRPSTSDLHLDACGACASCVRIARGVHPDVFLVQPGETGAIRIDQVRDAVDRTAYRPFEGRRRVVIVADADALVAPAQNALLKTLEEPAPSSVFILVTARPDALLATVRSRCIRLTFPAAAAASGLDEARAVAERVLTEAAAGPDPRRRIEAARELVAGSTGSGAAERDHLAERLHAVAAVLRDVEAVRAGADAAVLAEASAKDLDRLVAAFGGERGIRAFAAVNRALAAIEGNASAKIVADWLVLEL